MGRRKKSNSPLARIMRLVVLVRLAVRAVRVARRVHRMRRVIVTSAIAAIVGLIVRRRRAGSAPEAGLTYAPPPTPTLTPDGPPLDAAQGNGTQTERNLEAEKDS